MSLQVSKYSAIPEGAVVLSEEEAIKYQLKLIRNWKRPSDTWIFKYGTPILSSACVLSAVYINGYYRGRLLLRSFGQLSSYIPIVVLPASAAFLLHKEKVIPDVIIQRTCPICVQMRSAAIQSILGVIFPSIIAPLGSLAFAIQYGTYNVPNITSKPGEVFRMVKGFTKPIGPILLAMFVGHAALGSFCAYLEGNAVNRINNRLNELEKELENIELP